MGENLTMEETSDKQKPPRHNQIYSQLVHFSK
jgi:hypothetical protein